MYMYLQHIGQLDNEGSTRPQG